MKPFEAKGRILTSTDEAIIADASTDQVETLFTNGIFPEVELVPLEKDEEL